MPSWPRTTRPGPRHGGHRPGQERHRAGRGAPGREPQRVRAGQAPAHGRAHGRERLRQREQAARTAQAQLVAARDGLKVAEAEKAQIEAQRRELTWRRGRTEVVAPADGIISRRMARVGGYAAGAAEPMFRIVAKGEVELDAEVTETRMAAVRMASRRASRSRASARSPAPCAWSRRRSTRHAARPRAHLPGRQSGPAGRRLRPRHHRDRQRPRAGGARLRHPLRAGRSAPSRSCATTASRRAGSRPAWRRAR